MSFSQKIRAWYRENGRDLPWRNTSNSYVIWLSEVILQQTRVEQGTPYFLNFVEKFPTVESFANAEEDEILRLWQGLGYYSRARNMHKAAKQVMDDYNGIFPSNYVDLLKLKGVGEYSAAAISSFSSDEIQAVLDGNVFRVLSRYFGIDKPINSSAGKKLFQSLAQELIDQKAPGEYNHAIMDFGAIQCRPKNPLCHNCIFQMECHAYINNQVEMLPVKEKGKTSKNRYFNYFIVEDEGALLMSKRDEGDVWANLYEFPLIETEIELTMTELVQREDFKFYFGDSALQPIGSPIKQVLSHQNIFARFYKLDSQKKVAQKKINWDYILLEKIDTLAKHKLIFTFWEKYYD